MESRPSTLPKLIFLEDHHLSPLIPDLLAEWAPKLKDRGYTVFYDEWHPSYTLPTLIDIFESQFKKGKETEPLYEAIYILMDRLLEDGHYFDLPEQLLDQIDKNNIPLFNAAKKIVSYISFSIGIAYLHVKDFIIEKKPIPEMIVANIINYILNMINVTKSIIRNEMLSSQAEATFYRALEANQIRFQGVDERFALDSIKQLEQLNKRIEESNTLEEICQIQAACSSIELENTSIKSMKLRDSEIIKSYLIPGLAFGRVGALHVIGLQELILKNMTIEEASSAYTFIYPFDAPPYNDTIKKLRDDVVNNLSLNVIAIDLTDKSKINVDEILEQIISNNNKKINVPIYLYKYKHFLLGKNPSPDNSQDEQQDQSKDQKRFTFHK